MNNTATAATTAKRQYVVMETPAYNLDDAFGLIDETNVQYMMYEDSGDPAQPDLLLDVYESLPSTIETRIISWGDVHPSGELIRQSATLQSIKEN